MKTPLLTTSFFQALIGTCKGTTIFIFLMGQTLKRTCLHLFLLLLLASAILAGSFYFTYVQKVENVGAGLDSLFGQITLTDSGIMMQKTPDSAMSHFYLIEGIGFDYFPSEESYRSFYVPERKNEMCGVQLDQHMLLFWMKMAEGYFMFPLIAPTAIKKDPTQWHENSLNDIRGRGANLVFDPGQKLAYFSFLGDAFYLSTFVNYIFIVSFLFTYVFLLNTLNLFVTILMISFLFSFINYIFANPVQRTLFPFKRNLIMNIYSSFPPIILATIWAIFGLNSSTGISVETVIVFGMIIYSFFVQISLQRFFRLRK